MSWHFSPRWYNVLATAIAVPAFISLGFWQWGRGEHRREVWDAFEMAAAPAFEAAASELPRLPPYTRVRVAGRFDGARQFLLDNISHAGAPGYEVLTVLELAEGSRLLVNRGWVPFTGYRDRLPEVAVAGGAPLQLAGRIAALPVAGLASGQTPPATQGAWPRVTAFPDFAQLERAYGAPLLPVLLLLDADSGPGYLRDWQPPGVPPERNFGYAVQWWSFALLALAMFVGFNLKRRHV